MSGSVSNTSNLLFSNARFAPKGQTPNESSWSEFNSCTVDPRLALVSNEIRMEQSFILGELFRGELVGAFAELSLHKHVTHYSPLQGKTPPKTPPRDAVSAFTTVGKRASRARH